jgi:hypothetical protein
MIGLLALVVIFFKNAFSIHFFQDDYWFLSISRAHSLADFLRFFSPFRNYSYKPLATETFYLLIHWFNYNVFWPHLIMFAAFALGLVFVYKSLIILTGKKWLSFLTVGLYALHFTHVFQLYWFATFQEIALLMFLALSFYGLLKQKQALFWLAFLAALLCKETATLYPGFLILMKLTYLRKRLSWRKICLFLALSAGFYLVYKYSLDQVTTLDNYKMEFNLKLIANNTIWYGLWGLGLPNVMPLFMPKIFGAPVGEFWKLFNDHIFKVYFLSLLTYLGALLLATLTLLLTKKIKLRKFILFTAFCLAGYFIFFGPILFFPHRWMVRLTLPLLFLSLWQAEIMRRSRRWVTFSLLILYLVFNRYGTLFHEASSLIASENQIFLATQAFFAKHGQAITAYPNLFIADNVVRKKMPLMNSERLKNSFHDQSFIDFFLPGSGIKVYYDFETDFVPNNAAVVYSDEFIK